MVSMKGLFRKQTGSWLIKTGKTGVKYEKTHSLDHEHILSGILRCPLCGSGMYGNVNRKKKKDGTLYKDYFYYACKHRRLVDGHKCGYRKQWSEEKINNAVEEVIRKLVKNPKFEEAILNKIGSRIDTEEIEKRLKDWKTAQATDRSKSKTWTADG